MRYRNSWIILLVLISDSAVAHDHQYVSAKKGKVIKQEGKNMLTVWIRHCYTYCNDGTSLQDFLDVLSRKYVTDS